jgi:limonene-1,2-epoxide hydrolase
MGFGTVTRPQPEVGIVTTRIQIHRVLLDGADVVTAEFDDGTDDGEAPGLVELLGMLEVAKATALDLATHDGCDCEEDE